MGRNMIISFASQMSEGSRTETTSFQTDGLYYLKDHAVYICYEESHEHGKVKTIIKIKADEVLITRTGPISMRQLFKRNEITNGKFQSPLGTFQMETITDKIEYDWNNKNSQGKLCISYLLKLGEGEASRHTITIKFKEDIR